MRVASHVARPTNRTLIGSVLFVDIVGYSRRTVPEQLAMKERFNELLADAIQSMAPSDRIMVDTGDGAAIAFLGDPEDALFTALSLKDAIDSEDAGIPGEPGFVRMGINVGPLMTVHDINGHTNMIGDGVNDAQRVMSFADPGHLVVSHAYYDIISRFSHDYTKLFIYEGTRHDKHVREHEVYRFSPAEDTEELATNLRERFKARVAEENARTQPASRVRRLGNLALGPVRSGKKTFHAGLVALLVGAASMVGAVWSWTSVPENGTLVAANATAQDAATAVASAEPASRKPGETDTVPVASQTQSAAGAAPVPPAQPGTPAAKPRPAAGPRIEPASAQEKKPSAQAAAAAPGTVRFAVQPWGEIYINGSKRGISPPLKSVNLAPGKYRVEVRNGQFVPYKHTIEVETGKEMTIRYAF